MPSQRSAHSRPHKRTPYDVPSLSATLDSSTDHDITSNTGSDNEASGSTATSPVIIVVDPSRVLAFYRSPPLTLAGRMACINLYIQYHQPRPDGHIPRPMNSFLCFRKFCRAAFDLLDHESAVHVSKIAGAAWAALSQEEREYWDGVAGEVKKAHQLQYPGYKFRPQARTPKKVATKKSNISTAGKPAASKPRPAAKGEDKAAAPTTALYSQDSLIGLGQRSLPTPEPSPVGTHRVLYPPPLPSSVNSTTSGLSSSFSHSIPTTTSTSISTSGVGGSTHSHVTASAPAPPTIRVQIPMQPQCQVYAQAQAQALHEGTILTPASMVEPSIGAGNFDTHAFVNLPPFGVDQSFSTDDTFGAQPQPQPQPQAQFEPMSTGFAVDQWSSAPAAPSFVSPPSGSAVPPASVAPVAQASTAWDLNCATPVDVTPIDDSNGYNHGYNYTYTYDSYDSYHPFDVADRSSPLDDLNGLRGLPISNITSVPSMPSFDPDAPFELSAEPYHVQTSLGSMDSMDPVNSMSVGGAGALSSSASYEYGAGSWSYSGQTSSSGGYVEQGAAVGYVGSYY